MRYHLLAVPVCLLAFTLASSKPPGLAALIPLPPAVARLVAARALDVELLAPGLWWLSGGADGSVLVLSGDDGTLLVDSRAPGTAEELIAAVDALDLTPVRWVINTHYHEDHRGANAHYAGLGAVVIGHEQSRPLMQVSETIEAMSWTLTAASNETLPTVTIASPMTLYAAGHTVRLLPLPGGHTGSDLAVFIEDLDVLHTGDQFELGSYPFLDIWHGGSLEGLIKGVSMLLDVAGPETVIIPGHGPRSRREQMLGYHKMLLGVSEAIDDGLADEMDLEQLMASQPTSRWDDRWGGVASGRRFGAIAFLDATGER
ncbi:MAG: cyclase [Pseudohongiellaceae bacterium]|jgi:cyclase